jgi:PAS domain S-box-containing protein
MFFLKKKKPIRNKLPEKLVALKHNTQPSWVWDNEYRIIVWSNAKGLKFWNVDTREEIKELIFPEDNSMVTICDKVEKKLSHDKIISEAIIFPTRPVAKKIICELSKQELPDGRFGILITALTSVDDNQTVDNNNKINNKSPLETLYIEHTHQQQEETMNTPVDTSDMIKTETTLDKTDIHNMMLLKPATLSCNHDLIIVGVNEVSQSVLNLNEGDDCYLLFSDADVADFVFDRILGNAKTSFIQKIDIGYGVLPYLLQATQFHSEGIAYFNMGILQISEEKYQDFLVNDPDNVITSIPPKSDSFSNEYADNESSASVSSHKNTLYDKRHLSSSLMGDMTGVGLFNVQKDGVIKAVNQMASNLMGLSETSLVGRSIIDLFGTDATHVLKELIVNNNNDVLHDLEHGVRCQYQDINHNEHIAKLVVRPNNAENGFWFILNDITELERIKNELCLEYS